MAKTYKVKAKAPTRKEFPGFWTAQTFIPNGETVELEVTGSQLKDMLFEDENGLLMVEGAAALREQLKNDPDINVPAPKVVPLAPDEQAALDAYRKSKKSAPTDDGKSKK